MIPPGPEGRSLHIVPMKFTVADLLDHLSLDSPVETGVLAKILKLSNKSEKQDLELAIESLLKLGIIEKASDKGLLRSSDESLMDARLRCGSKGSAGSAGAIRLTLSSAGEV